MSPSWQTNQNKKFSDFRTLVEANDSEVIKLPEGSFKESGTNVNTVMLVMRKSGMPEVDSYDNSLEVYGENLGKITDIDKLNELKKYNDTQIKRIMSGNLRASETFKDIDLYEKRNNEIDSIIKRQERINEIEKENKTNIDRVNELKKELAKSDIEVKISDFITENGKVDYPKTIEKLTRMLEEIEPDILSGVEVKLSDIEESELDYQEEEQTPKVEDITTKVVFEATKLASEGVRVTEDYFNLNASELGKEGLSKLSKNQKDLHDFISEAIKEDGTIQFGNNPKQPTLYRDEKTGEHEPIKNFYPLRMLVSKDGNVLVRGYRERVVIKDGQFVKEPNAKGEYYDFRTYRLDRTDFDIKQSKILKFIPDNVKYTNAYKIYLANDYKIYLANEFSDIMKKEGIELDFTTEITVETFNKMKKIIVKNPKLWSKLCSF